MHLPKRAQTAPRWPDFYWLSLPIIPELWSDFFIFASVGCNSTLWVTSWRWVQPARQKSVFRRRSKTLSTNLCYIQCLERMAGDTLFLVW